MSGAIGGKRRGQPGGEKTDGAGQRRAAKGATDGAEKRRNTEENGEKLTKNAVGTTGKAAPGQRGHSRSAAPGNSWGAPLTWAEGTCIIAFV